MATDNAAIFTLEQYRVTAQVAMKNTVFPAVKNG
jgi:hypothetical protein